MSPIWAREIIITHSGLTVTHTISPDNQVDRKQKTNYDQENVIFKKSNNGKLKPKRTKLYIG